MRTAQMTLFWQSERASFKFSGEVDKELADAFFTRCARALASMADTQGLDDGIAAAFEQAGKEA